ncbi:MAG: HflC protein [Moraxellaceae bacterium]|nr:MAG: HflC protein [Moraxellaceae bacterium]
MNKLGGVIILLGALAMFASNTLYVVDETQRAVKLRFSEVVESDLEPGLGWKIPFVHQIKYFEARRQILDASPEEFLTVEKKRLIVDSYIVWKVDNVEKYFTATGGLERNAQILLAPRVNNGLRAKFGKRTVHEVISGEREELMKELTAELNSLTEAELGIHVVDIRVKRVDLPSTASEAVYARMRAEREREAREYRANGRELAEGIQADADRQVRVIAAEAYRDAEKVKGEGDAIAAATYSNAFSADAEFYAFYRSMDAYRKTFGNKGDLMVLEPDSDFFKYLKQSKVGKN